MFISPPVEVGGRLTHVVAVDTEGGSARPEDAFARLYPLVFAVGSVVVVLEARDPRELANFFGRAAAYATMCGSAVPRAAPQHVVLALNKVRAGDVSAAGFEADFAARVGDSLHAPYARAVLATSASPPFYSTIPWAPDDARGPTTPFGVALAALAAASRTRLATARVHASGVAAAESLAASDASVNAAPLPDPPTSVEEMQRAAVRGCATARGREAEAAAEARGDLHDGTFETDAEVGAEVLVTAAPFRAQLGRDTDRVRAADLCEVVALPIFDAAVARATALAVRHSSHAREPVAMAIVALHERVVGAEKAEARRTSDSGWWEKEVTVVFHVYCVVVPVARHDVTRRNGRVVSTVVDGELQRRFLREEIVRYTESGWLGCVVKAIAAPIVAVVRVVGEVGRAIVRIASGDNVMAALGGLVEGVGLAVLSAVPVVGGVLQRAIFGGSRVVVYDASGTATDVGDVFLRLSWFLGAEVMFGHHFTHAIGVSSLDELVAKVGALGDGTVTELQFWGHGYPGGFCIGRQRVGVAEVRAHAALGRVFAADAVVALRTCESFRLDVGRRFAETIAATWRVRAAGFLRKIGLHQPGLVCCAPGAAAWWGDDSLRNTLLATDMRIPERMLLPDPVTPIVRAACDLTAAAPTVSTPPRLDAAGLGQLLTAAPAGFIDGRTRRFGPYGIGGGDRGGAVLREFCAFATLELAAMRRDVGREVEGGPAGVSVEVEDAGGNVGRHLDRVAAALAELSAAEPASVGFDVAWRAAAGVDEATFALLQRRFVVCKEFSPLIGRLALALPRVDLGAATILLHDVLFALHVAAGAAATLSAASAVAAQLKDGMCELAVARALYAEALRRDADGVYPHLARRTPSPLAQAAIASEVARQRARALGLEMPPEDAAGGAAGAAE